MQDKPATTKPKRAAQVEVAQAAFHRQFNWQGAFRFFGAFYRHEGGDAAR
jgi:hypothetical protein